jgi:hypothetical protein
MHGTVCMGKDEAPAKVVECEQESRVRMMAEIKLRINANGRELTSAQAYLTSAAKAGFFCCLYRRHKCLLHPVTAINIHKAPSMVHELFLRNCELEHLRKGAAIGITNNEARDVA